MGKLVFWVKDDGEKMTVLTLNCCDLLFLYHVHCARPVIGAVPHFCIKACDVCMANKNDIMKYWRMSHDQKGSHMTSGRGHVV